MQSQLVYVHVVSVTVSFFCVLARIKLVGHWTTICFTYFCLRLESSVKKKNIRLKLIYRFSTKRGQETQHLYILCTSPLNDRVDVLAFDPFKNE